MSAFLRDEESLPIETVNAVIESASILLEQGFALSSWLMLSYGGSGQGFGGFVLGGCGDEKTPAAQHATQPNFAAEWITAVLRAGGVENWSELTGKVIRVRREAGWNGRIIGIGHAIKDDCWFLPAQRFDELMSERAKRAGEPK